MWRLTIVTLVIVSACNPTTPSSVDELRITPELATMKVRDSQLFVAMLSGRPSKSVLAEWRSENQAVVGVDDRGNATAFAVGTASISATYGGRVASRQITVVNNIDGHWIGQTVVTQCDHPVGEGINPCRFTIGVKSSFDLMLTQSQVSVVGQLVLSGNRRGDVTGTVSGTNVISITGTLISIDDGTTDSVSDWTVTNDPISGTMEGHFLSTQTFTNIFGSQVVRWHYDFQATRQ
jgi:hypothetical protein